MTWNTDAPFDLDVGGTRLEARAWGPPPIAAPTIVLLHEGLGSANMWRALPEALTAATGAGVLAYSRAGYGNSAPNPPPWPLDYLEVEANTALPGVLQAAGITTALLVGHSDGGSIAAAYLGRHDDPRIRAAVLIAPHFFTEAGGLDAIRAARQAFPRDIRPRLARHHRDVDALFEGWSGAWGDPDFKVGQIEPLLPNIRVPVLAIQGRQDQYGTLKQIEALTHALPTRPEIAILDDCGHSPHVEKPDDTARLIADFARKTLF